MNVALVCPYDLSVPGGVQNQVRELHDRLTAAGHRSWMVAPGSGEDWVSAGGVLTVRGNASNVPLAPSPRAIRRVTGAIAEADVVHIHEPLMPMVSLGALFGGDRPRVATFHAAAPGWVQTVYRLAGRPLEFAFQRSVVTAVSPTAAAALPERWGPVTVIPNGVDTASYGVEVERRPHRIVVVGRDEPRKGLDVLLRAWSAVREGVPDAELLVVGATRAEAPAGVRFLGRVSEVEKREALASSAIYVAPHLGGESFGIVLVEALAAGCCVVASDLEPFRAVGRSAAVYVPPGKHGELGAAIIELLRDGARRRTLSNASAERASAFDWTTVMAGYLDAYRRSQSVV